MSKKAPSQDSFSDVRRKEREFFEALGWALRQWQNVESAAYFLYFEFMKGADQSLASLSFHHIQSFDSRLKLIDKCTHFTVRADPLSARWKKLKVRLNAQNKMRNRIVHFSYNEVHEGGKVTFHIAPSSSDASYAINDRWKLKQNYIDTSQLRLVAHHFDELSRDLAAFTEDFRAIAK